MAESLNSEIADGLVSRAVTLQRLSAGETRKVLELLRKLEKDLVAELIDVDPAGATRTAFKRSRLEKLLREVQRITREHYSSIHRTFQKDLKEIATLEGAFSLSVINAPIGIELASVALTPERLRAIASETLIAGSSLREWWGRQSVDLQRRFSDTLRQGMLRGENLQDLLNRVRGRKSDGYTSGVMQASRRSAETLILSATASVSAEVHEQTWLANADVVQSLIWRSVLDLKTSVHCVPRDGKEYTLKDHRPIGHSIPWGLGPGRQHPRCRSVSTPRIRAWADLSRTDALLTGGRPTSISRYVRKRLEDKGLEGSDLDRAFSTVRSSMSGPVEGNLTYLQWLKKRSVEEQNQVLGVGRAKLWRSGKLHSLVDLLDQTGRPLSLKDLQ